MRAVRTIDGEFGVVRADLSDDDADGVVVDVVAAGICGSDLHMRTLGIQVTFGHEFSGRLGDGTAVAVQPLVHCGTCDRCEAGQSHICRESGGTMYGIARDGGMADQVRVDPSCLVSLPDGLSVADACLVEPLAVAQHACNGVDVEAGQRVLVIGAGGLGAPALQYLAGAGIGHQIMAKRAGGEAALAVMDEHLAERDWFVGSGATLADIALYPYTHVCEAGGFRLHDYPAVCRWLKRVSGLPGYVPMD